MIKEKELPKNWKLVELGEICSVDSGQGAPQKEEDFTGDEIFVKAGDLNKLTKNKFVGDFCKKINSNTIINYKLKKYLKNSIVFPKSGMSIMKGNIALLKYDSYIVNHLAIIKEKNNLININYIFYYIKKLGVAQFCKNDAYPSIRLSDLNIFKIPIPHTVDGKPDLQAQQRIVYKLELIETLK
jgi:hypothetical protein